MPSILVRGVLSSRHQQCSSHIDFSIGFRLFPVIGRNVQAHLGKTCNLVRENMY